MDVKRPAWIGIYGCCLLGLSLGTIAHAAEDDASLVIVSSDDGVEYATDDSLEVESEPAEPSDIVIHVVDDQLAAEPAGEAAIASAEGDVALVASEPAAELQAPVMIDEDVVPAAHAQHGRERNFNWNGVFNSGPRRPAMSSGIQGPQRPSQYESPAFVGSNRPRLQAERRATNDAPPAYDAATSAPAAQALPAADLAATRAPAATSLQNFKSPLDHAKAQLVNAYQLSLSASKEAEYSQIIQWCSAATRIELDAETRSFADNLSAWALNRRGQVRADEGQGELALADFNAALELTPENWRAMHNRAVTLAQRGDFAESFDDLCRVIQGNPKFAKAYANRATLYVQAGEMERASADFDSALATDPELLAALVGRGRVCHLLGRLDDALASLDSAVKLAPQDADIVCSRADLLADLGRYEDALLDYAQAIDLNKKFEHAYRNGAWLLATCPDDSIRDVEGAIAGAQAALDCGYGERHAALDTMAAALANAGRFEEAVGTIQQAIDIAPMEVRDAYQARQQLYEAGQPFRTQPVGSEAIAEADDSEPVDDTHSAVYIEE
jgi:tetratricopeptide (TPR) repeat protein